MSWNKTCKGRPRIPITLRRVSHQAVDVVLGVFAHVVLEKQHRTHLCVPLGNGLRGLAGLLPLGELEGLRGLVDLAGLGGLGGLSESKRQRARERENQLPGLDMQNGHS